MSKPLAQVDIDEDIDLLVRSEKLRLFYQQSVTAIYVSVLTAGLIVMMLWPVQKHTILLSWFGTLVIAMFYLLFLFMRYKKARPQGSTTILKWGTPYFTSHAIIISIWAIGAVWVMPKDSLIHQTAVCFFILGMAGGALSSYSAHRRTTLLSVFGMLFPMIIWLFFFGDSLITNYMAIAATIFCLASIRTTGILATVQHQRLVLIHQLRISSDNAKKLARIDELTGLYNRRAFYETADLLFKTSQRTHESIALILMDIDYFKRVNDTFGHTAGDLVLTKISQILQQTIRDSDTCARIGGEEFAIIFLSSSHNNAIQLAEKIRLVIANTPIEVNHEKLSITASFGVAMGDKSINNTFRRADEAMYQAKGGGRNRVMPAPRGENT